MSKEAFEVLGLPVEHATHEDLERAYLDARRIWFFRQYSPEFMLDAKGKLDAIEEAYHSLKSPHQQAAILRAARGEIRQAVREESSTPAKGEPPLIRPLVNRPLLVRSLLQSAEKIAAEHSRPLLDDEIESLAVNALRQGMEWSDAREMADKIATRIESKFPAVQRNVRRKPS